MSSDETLKPHSSAITNVQLSNNFQLSNKKVEKKNPSLLSYAVISSANLSGNNVIKITIKKNTTKCTDIVEPL